MSIKSSPITVPQPILDNLQRRLARTRWPDQIDGTGWSMGADLTYLQELVGYWRSGYSWRAEEAKLNQHAFFSAEIDGRSIRFIHARGKGPRPTPIILLHGWPDSLSRYLKLIPLLTDPAAFGGDPSLSFDVIVPSLLEPTPGGPRSQVLKQISQTLWRLMRDELGYERFAAAGGDGGSVVAQLLAAAHPEAIIGLHLTDIGFHRMFAPYTDLSEAEQQYLATAQAQSYQESAYAMQLGTRPQTVAFALNDSPSGLAAWMIEKFYTWSDCDGQLEQRYTKDELITNIMLYWIAGVDPRGYREEWSDNSLSPEQQIDVPVGLALPPRDLTKVPPREFAERHLRNIQRWTVLARGGHFVAMEFPELVAEDLRAFFAPLRAGA